MNGRTPEQLAQRRARMLAESPVGMLLLGAGAAVEEANPAAVRMLGLAPNARSLEALRGRLLDPARSVEVSDADLPWQQALRGQTIHNEDLLLLVPNTAQRRLLTITAVPFQDPGGCAPGALVMIVDRVQLLLRVPVAAKRRRRRAQSAEQLA